MSTTTTQSDVANISFWQKSLNWLRVFEDAMDFDPTQASIDRLNDQVIDLQNTVDALRLRLNAEDPTLF